MAVRGCILPGAPLPYEFFLQSGKEVEHLPLRTFVPSAYSIGGLLITKPELVLVSVSLL